jgi:hypothetical protein
MVFVMSHECERDFGVILVVLYCTIVGCAIEEQRSYVAGISFGLVARHKSMLYQPLLGGFMAYPFL